MTDAVHEAFGRKDTGLLSLLARLPIVGRFFVVSSVVVTCPNDHACEYPRTRVTAEAR